MIHIGKRSIGPGQPCFIIAEAGVNHNGNLDLALQLVDAAAEAGADAVKFQTFRAQHLVIEDAPMSEYQVQNTGVVESQYEMLKRLELSEEHHRALMRRCEERGVLFMSTPFDDESADLLNRLGVAILKTSSGDMTTTPFLRRIAAFGVPMIVSSGMADLTEVVDAVNAVHGAGNHNLILLHCVSKYPSPISETNLLAMRTMAEKTGCLVGLSDHTLGLTVAVAAIALGACVLEKHITLDHTLPGPDHVVSQEPQEFRAYVQSVREVESALGDGVKKPRPCEEEARRLARKSVVAAINIAKGTRLTLDMLTLKRPGYGLPPARLHELTGRVTAQPLRPGTMLAENHLLPPHT